MLNLVQLQERLKDVPMQALMSYANGMNPQIPPFLALGELNRRKKMQEGAAAEQAKEMEGAPTIKEQIEQSAGLLALQGNRQRQAAQQQQGIQANMAMAAPNTTTSEPAQLAGGGFIDDIVVPRDYQMGGGVINPDVLKQVMYREAMQGDVADIPKELMDAVRKQALRRAPGIPGLPISRDMFKRGDYAGGGIVAFAGTDGSFVDPAETREPTQEELDDAKKRGLVNLVRRAIAGGGDPEFYSKDINKEVRNRELRRTGLSDAQQSMIEDARDRAMSQIMAGPKVTRLDQPAAPPRAAGVAGLPRVPDAVSKYLDIDPSTAIPDIPETTAEAFRKNLDEASKVFGVSGDPYKERKRRYGEIEAEDKRRRAEQPMDQLSAFLSGMAEARGGNVFTQAAKGARASRELRAEQNALNRKQDLDMAELISAIGEKEDALNRGDRDKFLSAQQAERDARRNLAKDRIALRNNQAQIANQSMQAMASAASAAKPSTFAEQLALFRSNPEEFDRFMKSKGMSDEAFGLRQQQNVEKLLKEDPRFFEYRILSLSSKPEDQKKAEQIRAQAYAQAGISMGGGTPNVTVTKISN